MIFTSSELQIKIITAREEKHRVSQLHIIICFLKSSLKLLPMRHELFFFPEHASGKRNVGTILSIAPAVHPLADLPYELKS